MVKVKKLLLVLCSIFVFQNGKSQCLWEFRNELNCSIEFNFCWDNGGTPICQIVTLLPGCIYYPSIDTLAMPTQFCNGYGNFTCTLIQIGSLTCAASCDFVDGYSICCNQSPLEFIPNCSATCECGKVSISPFNSSLNYFQIWDYKNIGISDCAKPNEN